MIADDIDVRPTRPDELRAAADTFRIALMFPVSTDADWAKPGATDSWNDALSVSAWDGPHCVGHAGGFRFTTLVPGGAEVPLLGVTRVGVLPTHTRRGILSRSMHRLLVDARAEGFPLAGLRASEAVIYGRFGFGVAAENLHVEIDHRGGAGRVVAPVAPGSFRMLQRDDALAVLLPLQSRVGLDRVGTVRRPEWMQRRIVSDAGEHGKAASVVVHCDPDGIDDGWVLYRLEWGESFTDHVRGECEVIDLWGATPAVELALWRFVLGLDLVDRVQASDRPVDDPLRFALDDQRRYHVRRRNDEQWLRLLDVDAALRARTYLPVEGTVTVAVSDPMFPDNDGVWRVGAAGAQRVDTAPVAADLAATINGISAAYLGGTSWFELAAAGVVNEQRPGAVRLADALFASRPLPRCGTFY